jgi:adenylate cyclase
MVYRRRREHVWTEHAINYVEEALESSGLQARVPQPPAICFVDLTGYTRLTEERGDEAAAQVAGRLVGLVNDISRRPRGPAHQMARGRRDVLLPGARGSRGRGP